MVEALLFAAAEPLSPAEIAARLPKGCDADAAIAALRRRYEGRGVSLTPIAGKWAFRTAPDLGWLMRREVVETRPLSRAAVETLAIIAYHQPVTRAEIEEIRGVAVSKGTLDLLMERDWVRLGRRRQTPGRPATFAVTEGFLDHFGLSSARDLPGLRELREAGLLERTPPGEAGAEGAPTGPAQSRMFEDDEAEARDDGPEAGDGPEADGGPEAGDGDDGRG